LLELFEQIKRAKTVNKTELSYEADLLPYFLPSNALILFSSAKSIICPQLMQT
jgi:hypothetical protein